MLKYTEFSKDISLSIKFDSEYVSLGNDELIYHTPKLGSNKLEQQKYVLDKLQLHKKQITEAIKLLRKEWK